MTAARKALEALEVPLDQRWVPATWVNDDGEWVARGPLRVNRMPTRKPGESDDDYADRCLDADSSEPGCDADQQAHADAERACLSVNLSAPLAAVARAAMEWREAIRSELEGSPFGGPVDPFNGSAAKARRALDAALDAFNAAALAQGFQP